MSGGTTYERDVIALQGEEVPGGEGLLEPVLVDGARTSPSPPLEAVRKRRRRTLQCLPQRLRQLELEPFPPYPVELSAGVEALLAQVGRAHGGAQG